LGWYAPPPWGGRSDVLSGYEACQSGENVPNHFPAGSRILNFASCQAASAGGSGLRGFLHRSEGDGHRGFGATTILWLRRRWGRGLSHSPGLCRHDRIVVAPKGDGHRGFGATTILWLRREERIMSSKFSPAIASRTYSTSSALSPCQRVKEPRGSPTGFLRM
jgi:hypothetical protein